MPYKDPQKRREAVRKSKAKRTEADPTWMAVTSKNYYAKNAEKRRAQCRALPGYLENRRVQNIKRYGITVAQRDRMLEEQMGNCFLCGESFGDSPRDCHIDHDHRTGEVRGLLDGLCNRALGLFRDNPDAMRAGATYVEAHQERFLSAWPMSASELTNLYAEVEA